MLFRSDQSLRTLVFSKDWSKLTDRVFTNLRKTCCYFKVNEKVQVYIKQIDKRLEKRFIATVIFKSKQKLRDISTSLITYDTDTKTRQEAFQVLQKFYHLPLTEDTEFYLLLLKKEDS